MEFGGIKNRQKRERRKKKRLISFLYLDIKILKGINVWSIYHSFFKLW